MKTQPDEPINPIPMVDEDGNHYIDKRNYGLTKREYFTGLAMSGLTADHSYNPDPFAEKLAEMAVKIADAIIKELNK